MNWHEWMKRRLVPYAEPDDGGLDMAGKRGYLEQAGANGRKRNAGFRCYPTVD